MMASKQFKSKIDLWILLLLLAVVVIDVAVIVRVAMQPGDPVEATVTILVCVAAMALFLSLLLKTHYTVNSGELRIVSGPFRRKIAVAQIISVTPTRNPLSSPALSLDRLMIRYGKGRRIIVSPADKQGFLRAIGHDEN